MTTALSFTQLRTANATRQIEWDRGNKITLLYRTTELAGEVGEFCNEIKKLERERMGINGSRSSQEKAVDELADVIICADLIGMQMGIDLSAAVARKFNLTSRKYDLKTMLQVEEPSKEVGGFKTGEIVNAEYTVEPTSPDYINPEKLIYVLTAVAGDGCGNPDAVKAYEAKLRAALAEYREASMGAADSPSTPVPYVLTEVLAERDQLAAEAEAREKSIRDMVEANGRDIERLTAERDKAWQELNDIRAAIHADPEESTVDEVKRMLAGGKVLSYSHWDGPRIISLRPRPRKEWTHEDGDVLWWVFPIDGPPWVGSPLDTRWDDDLWTHWTPFVVPKESEMSVAGEVIDADYPVELSVLEKVAAKRAYQIARGYDAAHDDQHVKGELLRAAHTFLHQDTQEWPWPDTYGHILEDLGKNPRADFIKGIALLIAEQERRDRAKAKGGAA